MRLRLHAGFTVAMSARCRFHLGQKVVKNCLVTVVQCVLLSQIWQ